MRIVEAGAVVGIALTGSPVYRGSTVELRRRHYARGRIFTDAELDCSCVGPVCAKVKFKPGAFDRLLQDVETGAANIQATTGARDAGHLLADTRSGTLRFDLVDPDAAAALYAAATRPAPPTLTSRRPAPLPATRPAAGRPAPDMGIPITAGRPAPLPAAVEDDVPEIISGLPAGFDVPPAAGSLTALLAWFLSPEVAETEAGRQLAEAVKVAEVVARPIIDQEASTWEDIDGVRVYSEAIIRLLLIKAAPGTVTGWEPITVNTDDLTEPELIIQPDDVATIPAPVDTPRRRRFPAWL